MRILVLFLGSIGVLFGGSFMVHLGFIWVYIGVHSGSIQGPFWVHMGSILSPFGVHCGSNWGPLGCFIQQVTPSHSNE